MKLPPVLLSLLLVALLVAGCAPVE